MPGPTQDRILALAAELGIATFPTYDDGAKVLRFRGKRGTHRGAIPRCTRRSTPGPPGRPRPGPGRFRRFRQPCGCHIHGVR